MKNLANCTPTEFFKQTNLIRKSVSKWLTDTDIVNIRKRIPALPEDISLEERTKAMEKQANENFTAILDAIMEEHPDETLELLALVCFVDPKDIDKHPMSEYMGAIAELLSNVDVLNFFTSLTSLVNQLT